MKKNNLISKLLIIILIITISLITAYFLYRRFSIKQTNTSIVENTDIKEIKTDYNNLEKNMQENNTSDTMIEEVTPPSNKNPISNSKKNNTKTTSENNSKKKSASNNNSSSSSIMKDNSTKKEESPKETINDNTAVNQTTTVDDKKEDTSNNQSIEITFEVPDKSSLKNDPEYIRLMKTLYDSEKECDAKGDEVRISDMDNILTSTCEAVYYKEAEIGWKLRIKYVDGTYKYYNK